jgi:hypothetical protein
MVGTRIRFSSIAGSALMSLLVCALIVVYLRLEMPEALSGNKDRARGRDRDAGRHRR